MCPYSVHCAVPSIKDKQGVVSLLFKCKLEPFAPLGASHTSWFVSVSMWHRRKWRLQAVNCRSLPKIREIFRRLRGGKSHFSCSGRGLIRPNNDRRSIHYPAYYTATCQHEKKLHSVLPFSVFQQRNIVRLTDAILLLHRHCFPLFVFA